MSAIVTTSGQKIIKRALRLLGVLGVGKALSSEEQADGLEALNGMLDSWNTEKLALYTRAEIDKILTPGTQTYTIGVGGNINTDRPAKIEQGKAFLRSDGADYPLDVWNTEQWASQILKSVGPSLPIALYYDAQHDLGNINLWPKPDQAYTLVLFLDQLLTQITNPATAFSLPPGYYDALCFNLALLLAPEYGKDPSAVVVARAIESKANIKRANIVPPVMAVDPAVMQSGAGRYNILTGE